MPSTTANCHECRKGRLDAIPRSSSARTSSRYPAMFSLSRINPPRASMSVASNPPSLHVKRDTESSSAKRCRRLVTNTSGPRGWNELQHQITRASASNQVHWSRPFRQNRTPNRKNTAPTGIPTLASAGWAMATALVPTPQAIQSNVASSGALRSPSQAIIRDTPGGQSVSELNARGLSIVAPWAVLKIVAPYGRASRLVAHTSSAA